MKIVKLLSFAAIVSSVIFSCTKQNNSEKPIIHQQRFTDVVLENKEKDLQAVAINVARKTGKGCPGNNPHCNTPPTTQIYKGCILLDFDGQLTSGTLWNTGGDILSAASGITDPQMIKMIVDSVKYDYSFNAGILLTTDESIFYTYPINKRTRVIITTSNEWNPGSGGIAYLNSFNWFDDTPAFVFSNALGFSIKNISEACSHEAGHTLSLRHQSQWELQDGVWVKISDYDWGCCGYAPIMGASYNQPNGIFKEGRNSIGEIQNDTAWINNSIRL